MRKYNIVITGKKYNENYFFEEPKEGNVKDEILAIVEELKKGNISAFTVKEVSR